MKIDLGSIQRRNVEVGDIVVCENATYLVARDEACGVKITFPILCIDLETGIEANGYMNIGQLETAHQICRQSGDIITVLKSDEVQLIRLQSTRDITCNLGSLATFSPLKEEF